MKSIIDCVSGEITKIDLDKVSKDQQILDEADITKAKAIADSEAEAKEAAKAALLARLGITADEAKLLLA